jgi:hypothetical protein
MAVDGLAELRAQRSRRTGGRGLPAPQHPKAEPGRSAQPDVEKSAGVTTDPQVTSQTAPVVEAQNESAPAAARPEWTGPAEQERVEGPEEQLAPMPRRSRVRATQVHLDQASEDHLSELRKRAVLADVDLTQSAVLRLALAELVERHGYDRIVRIFAEDAPTIRRGRPRR